MTILYKNSRMAIFGDQLFIFIEILAYYGCNIPVVDCSYIALYIITYINQTSVMTNQGL